MFVKKDKLEEKALNQSVKVDFAFRRGEKYHPSLDCTVHTNMYNVIFMLKHSIKHPRLGYPPLLHVIGCRTTLLMVVLNAEFHVYVIYDFEVDRANTKYV